ncbi:hypothetical protein EZ449_03255 [Pedobacter frigidisoli]|uniref:DUF1579 domain-containing protein n=1 Tax=Pedobacter frigidisoli TaxID=2530455 RepID=A0A4R0P815_9SPHI|nr:hypothetical protein [Pedobacter frigidisoli]TCD12054.1 hypothetical protein EZ449_03255 [Pedobacter frigidisoli]
MSKSKLQLLAPYIGVWKTQGTTGNGDLLSGTDIYEWVEGGFFLLHKVDVELNGKEIKSLEITHYDELEDVFRSQSFDDEGNISISTLKIYDDIILIFSDNERFKGNFKESTIEGTWERCDGKKWSHWMKITLTKLVGE